MIPAAAGPVHRLYGTLSRTRRRELVAILFLMPATAMAEAITVAAIVPFLGILTGQAGMTTIVPAFRIFIHGIERITMLSSLAASAALFALCIAGTAILRLALNWKSQQFAFGAGHEVSVEIQRRLLHQPYSFHLHRHSSENLASLDKVDHLVFNLFLQAIEASSAALVGIFIVGLLVTIDPLAAGLSILIAGGLFGLASLVARRGFERHSATIATAYERRLRALQESAGTIRDVILDHSQGAQVERFQKIDKDFMRSRARAAFLMAAPRAIVEAVGLLLVSGLAIVIAGRPGGIAAAVPVLAALALGTYRLLPFMGQLYGAWAHLRSSRPILADVTTLLSLQIPEEEPGLAPLPFLEEIRFEGVSFLYPDRVHHALHDFSFVFRKGSRIAITGHTGSGKSTVADLLMGLIRPTDGRIIVDGAELTASRLPAWRKAIAHVPQSVFLADASIAANIALTFDDSPPDLDRVRRAARIAQIDDFAEALTDGYGTRVGEHGMLLSGGQRQRLVLARALYKQAPILVLDEATSALDERTESAVIAALDELRTTHCTIIIIAHRASTIATCDRVLVLKDGMLVEPASRQPPVGRQFQTEPAR